MSLKPINSTTSKLSTHRTLHDKIRNFSSTIRSLVLSAVVIGGSSFPAYSGEKVIQQPELRGSVENNHPIYKTLSSLSHYGYTTQEISKMQHYVTSPGIQKKLEELFKQISDNIGLEILGGDADVAWFVLLDQAASLGDKEKTLSIMHAISEFYPAYPELRSTLTSFYNLGVTT